MTSDIAASPDLFLLYELAARSNRNAVKTSSTLHVRVFEI
jgi:hypothetical protein